MTTEEQQAQVRALGDQLRMLKGGLNPSHVYDRGSVILDTVGYALWADCPRCGISKPYTAVKEIDAHFKNVRLVAYTRRYPDLPACDSCQQVVPLRRIKLRVTASQLTTCDLRCLNAKGDDCNCPCEGQCHGRGTCSCTKEEEND